MKKWSKENIKLVLYPHSIVIFCFVCFSLLFYYPLLSGKKLIQSDIRQYEGMSRQLKEHRKKTNSETYWIDNAFGGMPTYQLGAQYPSDFLSPIYSFFRFLPRPAHILFIYLLGSYLLFIIMNYNWIYALFGSIAFSFSTYLLIILQVGHNTKALAISFFPFVISGIFLLFKKRWLFGFILSSIAFGMHVRANHYQMTYYLLFLIGFLLLTFGYHALKTKKIKSFLYSVFILLLSGIVGLGFNSTSLLATLEYSNFSTRGASELTINPDGSPKEITSGLDFDYITEYSYGIFESLNIIAPRIQGGASSENLGTKHGVYDFLIENGVGANQAFQFSKNVPTYWGTQPILEAPAYIGISVFFFALIGIFFTKGALRNALLFSSLFSLFLSWGKNLNFLTEFFINYIPFYNKFRAVSSIQVILEFCLPILAVIGLNHLFNNKEKVKIRRFFLIGSIPIMILGLVYLFQGSLSFTGLNDSYFRGVYGVDLVSKIREARISIFNSDIFRGISICFLFLGIYYLYHIKIFKKNFALITIIILLIFDLINVANKYIDRDAFIYDKFENKAFNISSADRSILKDKSRYRVFEPALGLTGARTSFFHNSIGGYHGAKPRKFEEIFEVYKEQQISGILDFLNVKYLIYRNKESQDLQPLLNPNVLGPAWFVQELKEFVNSDSIIKALKKTDFSKTALILENSIPEDISKNFKVDSLTKINLVSSKPNHLIYKVDNSSEGFVVFSEMYYPNGWKAYIKGIERKIYNVNYVLRGVIIPKNTTEIEFKFEPEIVKTGTFLQNLNLGFFVFITSLLTYFQHFRKTGFPWE